MIDGHREGALALGHALSNDARVIDLPRAFRGGMDLLKLVIEESGTTAESGVILKAGREELIVVAGAFPYTLAVGGTMDIPFEFGPEYPLERYIRIPLA